MPMVILLKIKGNIYKEKELKYILNYSKKIDVLIILDNLYKDKKCTCLKRKYDKYKSFIGSPLQ